MHDCSRPIVYDGRSFLDASLRGTLREHRSKGEDTVLSLPLLTRFNDSIRESHHDDFLSSLSLYIYSFLEDVTVLGRVFEHASSNLQNGVWRANDFYSKST